MPKLLLPLVGLALVSAAALVMPRAGATVSMSPAGARVAVGNTNIVEEWPQMRTPSRLPPRSGLCVAKSVQALVGHLVPSWFRQRDASAGVAERRQRACATSGEKSCIITAPETLFLATLGPRMGSATQLVAKMWRFGAVSDRNRSNRRRQDVSVSA
jgi:hypothetical protein